VGRELNQTAVIDNRPGANGFLAAEFVARAPADGKTLLFTSNTTHAINPVLFKKLPYDPVKDFKPIAMVLTAPYVLIVRKDMPVRSVNELAAWIKANSDKAAYGWGASVSQIAGAVFLKRLNLTSVGVPYKSSPLAVTDLMGGQLSFMFLDYAAALPFVQGDRVKAIAVTSPKRIDILPDLPTMAESGMANFEVRSWNGMYAPAGTPDAVIQRYSNAVKRAMNSPALLKKLEQCCVPTLLMADEFAEFVRKDRALWTERAAFAGLNPE
jgi:tripartite-type tricarboxylate transporter receptor subunit TctC